MTELAAQHRAALGRATLGDQLRRHARNQPGKAAVVSTGADGRREVSYAELNRLANRAAHLLLGLGVARGDRVAVLARNRVETIAVYYGALKIGAVFTGINPLFRAGEIAQQLRHAEPVVLLAGSEFAAPVEAAAEGLPVVLIDLDAPATQGRWQSFPQLSAAAGDDEPVADVDELDVAMLVYTSGTEAAPKGVLIQHRNYLISTAPAWSWGLRTGPDDVWLFVMPFHTIAGLGSMTTLTMMGCTLVLPASTDAGASLAIIGAEGVTVIAQTPTFYLALAAHADFGPATVGSVQRCMTYGGQVSPAAIEGWAAAAPAVVWGTYWGQSELSQLGSVGWFRTLDDIPDHDPTWIGRPVTHLEIRVVDAAGAEAEIGELLCRTPSAMLGYFRDPERTAEVFAGGWVHTGDMVRLDRDGNLFFYDRVKDIIKSGGMNVSSQEVERVLHQHPAVLRAAVVGLPDDYWSEAVTAFVIARPGVEIDEGALIAHCRAELASFKAPKSVRVVREFPVDAQGKILKRQLRTGAGTATDSLEHA